MIFKIIFILAGIFSIVGSVFNWDWFFNSRKAARIVSFMGRNGARIFYIVLGGLIIFCGIIADL